MKYQQPFDRNDDPNAPYVNGNPSLGIQGSIIRAEGQEHHQRELVGLIAAAGLTPSAADLQQVLRAVRRQTINYAVATGTADALVVTLNPALEAYATGMILRIKVALTNTGAVTLNVNGLGPVSVLNPAGGPLIAYDLHAGSIRDFIFDGASWRVAPVITWPLIDQRITAWVGISTPAQMRTFLTSQTWTKPANLNFIRIRMAGGGASGGISTGIRNLGGVVDNHFGGGGGSGGYIEGFWPATALNATEQIIVGPGGPGRSRWDGAQNGAPGGYSMFKDWVAYGGGGGQGLVDDTGGFGEGGTAYWTGLAFATYGIRGAPGYYKGMGGASLFGQWGKGGNGGAAGFLDSEPGINGLVVIEEYLKPA